MCPSISKPIPEILAELCGSQSPREAGFGLIVRAASSGNFYPVLVQAVEANEQFDVPADVRTYPQYDLGVWFGNSLYIAGQDAAVLARKHGLLTPDEVDEIAGD